MSTVESGGTLAILQEFVGAKLGDERLNKRLPRIVERLAAAPAASFPDLFVGEAELESFYRFVANDQAEWSTLLRPHMAATVRRCQDAKVVRVAHDTTDFLFSGERKGLRPLMQQTQGFLAHMALAVAADDGNTCLGLVGMLPYVRTRARGDKSLNEWKLEARSRPRNEKESARWEKLAIEVSQRLGQGAEAIHVMDQEADDFVLLSELSQAHLRFVVRISSARQVDGPRSDSLQSKFDEFQGEEFRDVLVTARTATQAGGAKSRKVHPPRSERVAHLRIRWGELRLGKPQHAQAEQKELRLSVVQVFEPLPPEGEEPIQWTLATSEPVMSPSDALAVVDHYRARWLIEEYFKALKTGCAIEERQLTTYDGLLRALVLFIPIAWHMLLTRNLSREAAPPPATVLFSTPQLRRLATLYKARCLRTLPEAPTVRDALLALAKLGGHIRNNGPPGWLVLRRGYQRFLAAESAWRDLSASERCDQS